MPQPNAISPLQLIRRIGLPDAPTLLDVRTEEERARESRLLPCALLRKAASAPEWSSEFRTQRVIAICRDGGAASQSAAAWLRHAGSEAEFLEGGIDAWIAQGGPLLRPDLLPKPDARGRTVWVTRARPKVDRIACPWLIRRFVDPAAVFLFVSPASVADAAAATGATPFDVEGVFWSHRGAFCTFDVMIEEFGLHHAALDRLALIVRGADTGKPDLTPEAAGLLAASLGLSRVSGRPRPARRRSRPLRRLLPLVPGRADETHAWPAAHMASRPAREPVP